MRLEQFFEKFELFADFQNAVEKMRNLVLQLALQGRLVEQDPKEEPAGTLLRNVLGIEPDSLVKTDTPSGWKFIALGQLASLQKGRKPSALNTLGAGLPYLDIAALERGEFRQYTDDEKSPRATPNDLIIVCDGSRSGLVLDGADGVLGSTVSKINYVGLERSYLRIYLASLYEDLNGAKKGAAIPHLNIPRFFSLPIPVPPRAEQNRIVAKVDELMALCDRLEAQQQERDTRHAALARASLARFSEAPTPANLDFLFHKSYPITPADLRKTILTLAVQGKLVPQDSDDKPSESLLARLENDRKRIAAEQGVRLPKNVPGLDVENYPHDIPESWQWSRIGHLALVIDYGTSQKANNDSTKVPVYRMGNIVGGQLVDTNLKYVDPGIDDLPALYLRTNDILFNRTNSYELVGKSGIFKGPDGSATFASYLIRIRLPETVLFPHFFILAMNAPYFRETQIEPEIIQQCGQANFNGTKLASTVVPVPPLAEQRRIVAKVDQLMALVDQLEIQLAASRTTAKELMEAVVSELVSGSGRHQQEVKRGIKVVAA